MPFVLSGIAIATASVAALLLGDASFDPEVTTVTWDGSVATVTFREVDVALEADLTTISVEVRAEVDAVCTRGASTIHLHRAATALAVQEYPIAEDDVVDGVAEVPLQVKGLKVTGYTCVTTGVALTASLEDFWTGATLVHRT